MRETVYLGRDNPVKLQLVDSITSTPLDFTSVSKFELVLRLSGETDIAFDSDMNPAVFDWSEGSGKVNLYLGQEPIAESIRMARLIAYDPAHPNGQTLIHEAGDFTLQLAFKAS